jgi:outer membrane protein assembly factor BamB
MSHQPVMKGRGRWVTAAWLLIGLMSGASQAAEKKAFADPAPPQVKELPAIAAPAAQANPDVTFHAAPRPLPPGAVTHDWPCFLGPTHDYWSTETKLTPTFPQTGPPLVWEMKKGSGYAAPAILGDGLVLFHRVGDEERVECLHRETGQRYWSFAYATAYQDRYGYSDGPRCSPTIGGDSVFTYGAEGKLHCLDLATGRVRWRRDVLAEFKLAQNFFGVGSTPLLEADKLIVNVGARGGPCVAAFDIRTGKMAWGAGDKWGPSYASPVPATVHGKRRVFVFSGGESLPPSGGLLCIDPADGSVDFTFPWRGRRRESVNASSPLVFDNKVFISESYGAGGVLLELTAQPDGRIGFNKLWDNDTFGTHFMTAVHQDGYLYGVDGHGPHDAFLVCVEAKSGKEVWRHQPEWTETVQGKLGERKATLGTYRAWFMPVDGRYLCLGEYGHLIWADLTPKGYQERQRARLFLATETWTPPVLSRGLVYVCQNTQGLSDESPPRLLCYDFRSGN